MYIIVGLGNPGKRYENTRHNTGFIVLDMLADVYNIEIKKERHKALVGEGYICGHRVLLAKPQTYMNLSGEAVAALKNWYKADDNELIVVYDDIDLDVGNLRIRRSGSAGTHNGMRSIIDRISSQSFPRIRVGIGRPPKDYDLADYVLSTFSKPEIPPFKEACKMAVKGIEFILTNGIDKAMNECNRSNNPEVNE